MEVLKVSSRSLPNSVTGTIAGVIRKSGAVEIQTVGAGASNQTIKVIATACDYLAPSGIDIVYVPALANINTDGNERTAIKLIVEPQ